MVSTTSGAGSPSWSCPASQYSSVTAERSCHARRTTSARSAGYEWAMRPVYHTAVPAKDGRPRRQRDVEQRGPREVLIVPATGRRPLGCRAAHEVHQYLDHPIGLERGGFEADDPLAAMLAAAAPSWRSSPGVCRATSVRTRPSARR